MDNLTQQYQAIFSQIKTGEILLSPSAWAEKYRTLTSDVSTQQGKFSYDGTPYLREIVDTLSPYHPAKIVGIKKGAQIGLTEGLLVNGILWMIANAPGNCLTLSADATLNEEMIESRLDQGIQSCGIQDLIRPNTIRKKNARSGDTSKGKEYAGGRLFGGGLQSVNKMGKQRSIKYGFFDDWDAADVADKKQGSIFELLQQRFATSAKTMKQYFISTPETKPSNIDIVYDMGDQRHWFVPCPCCGEYIEIEWNSRTDKKDTGIVWDEDDNGKLIENSVRYICQECGDSFTEKKKYEINLLGEWRPTAEPSRPGIYSYYIPCFISAPWMYSWEDYVYKWLDIYKGGNESRSKLKVFTNVVMGLAYEEKQEQIKEGKLSNNIRDYEIGTVPTQLSREDGNGEIILLTMTCDMNGSVDDARLDYEVWAHSESGSMYSVDQGSIGTYYGDRNKNADRKRFTYENDKPDNVWKILDVNIMQRQYMNQDGGVMKITISAVDSGFNTFYAYTFIDQYKDGMVYAVKGETSDKFKKFSNTYPLYKIGRERKNLYILTVDLLKDQLSEMINLDWNNKDAQPAGFLNFPTPGGGKYHSKWYFKQYESEHKILETNEDGDKTGWSWEKKKSNSQNHFFDTAVYALGIRMIFARTFCALKKYGIKNADWSDYANIMSEIINKK